MIILEGNVINKVITGANGDFSVGNFTTDIGQFKIRSTLLDQFDEGEYRVRVSVNKIDLNSYMSKRNGIIITEMELDIDHLECIEGDVKPVIDAPIEPDVTATTSSPEPKPEKTVASTHGEPGQPKPKGARKPASSDGDADLAELFGLLWPLGDVVKLDSTTPRPLFIRQKDHLKSAGYTFNGMDQTWHRSPVH
jgi:hypothetical protein